MRRWVVCLQAAVLATAAILPARAEALKILTYNVGLLKVLGSDYVPLVDERERLVPAELARLLQKESVDIVLLQEVWRTRQAKAVGDALAPLGYTAIRPRVSSVLGLSSGLLLLVRTPLEIVEWKFTRFAKNTFTESLARKGVLEATIEDPRSRSRIALVGTHTIALDTKDGEPADQKQLGAFLVQAAQIVGTLERLSERGAVPAVLLGDFNVGAGYSDAAYRKIADTRGLEEAGTAVGPASDFISWDPQNLLVKYGRYPNEPPAKIDHIFLRGGASASWTVRAARLVQRQTVDGLSIGLAGTTGPIPVPLSDHYGFLVEAELSAQ